MTAYSDPTNVSQTLTAAIPDQITIGGVPEHGIEVYNGHATLELWANVNAAADPAANTNGCERIPPNTSLVVATPRRANNLIRVIGNGNPYTISLR